MDLRRALIGDEGVYQGLSWDEITEDLPKTSILLADSPHIEFLEQYCKMGESLFLPENFEQTHYFRLARQWAILEGIHSVPLQRERIFAFARGFITLYERIKSGDPTEVEYFQKYVGHSLSGSLPVVRHTLTPGLLQIVDGHHRLAVGWVLGQRKARVTLLPPMPTQLQSLVLSVAQNRGQRQLCQPIDRPEFDSSWELLEPCQDRLTLMLQFLSREWDGLQGLTVVNLGCTYGWFVAALAVRGCQALGVDPDPAALKIGRIAYGLRAEQLVQSDLPGFVARCPRTFDVVLLSGGLYDLARKSDSRGLAELLKRVDKITGRCLFLDTADADEHWWRRAFPDWDRDALIEFMKQQTSLTQVVSLSDDSNAKDSRRARPARALLACTRPS